MRIQLSILGLYLISASLFAADLGTVGQTYPIAEDDLLVFIQNRITMLKQNGTLEKIENHFRDNVQKHADRPSPVTTITRTEVSKTWQIDPSITAQNDYKDANGRVLVRAGTTVNPLNFIKIHHPMVFINGDDKEQVTWAKKINPSGSNKVKLVLVKGSITEMASTFQQPIYFDQEARITSRFHIQHVPAVAYQEKQLIRVSEVVL